MRNNQSGVLKLGLQIVSSAHPQKHVNNNQSSPIDSTFSTTSRNGESAKKDQMVVDMLPYVRPGIMLKLAFILVYLMHYAWPL